MKKIIMLICTVACCFYYGHAIKTKTDSTRNTSTSIPLIVVTAEDLSWIASRKDAAGYQKIELTQLPDSSGEEHPVLLKARFKQDGSFYFVYGKKNKQGHSETETIIEGRVLFTKNEDGKNCFITKAQKGISQKTINGHTTEFLLKAKELSTIYSNTYLWEKMSFKDAPLENFLLLVNQDEHPAAGNAKPGCINKTWVSKFYLRK